MKRCHPEPQRGILFAALMVSHEIRSQDPSLTLGMTQLTLGMTSLSGRLRFLASGPSGLRSE
jgi:hypothetical protein